MTHQPRAGSIHRSRRSALIGPLLLLLLVGATPTAVGQTRKRAKAESKEVTVGLDQFLKQYEADLLERPTDAIELPIEELYQLYREGKQAFENKSFAAAARFFWAVIRGDKQNSEFLEAAKFYLAKSLFELDFNYAALEYFAEVIRTGSAGDYVSEAMDIIERFYRDRLPFDEEAVLHDLVNETTFGFLSKRLEEFVNYQKGRMSLESGYDKFATFHFEQIPADSPYAMETRYVQAVQSIEKEELPTAIDRLNEIISAPPELKIDELRHRAKHTKARLYYEQKKLDEALTAYEEVRFPIRERAWSFLERGLVYYLKADFQKSLGLFHALGAPIYKNFFAPERYIYMSLTYKQLCLYEEARIALQDFARKYGNLLKMIKQRQDLLTDEHIYVVVAQDPILKRRFEFMKSAEEEQRRLHSYRSTFRGDFLHAHLNRMYYLIARGMAKEIEIAFEAQAKRLANTLLETEEQAKILLYELRLDSLRRIRRDPNAITRVEKIPLRDANQTYWPFIYEYWTDELEDYLVLVKNRCDVLFQN